MNCEWVCGRLSEHLDDELDRASAARVEEHLGSCSACAGTMGQLLRASRALRSLPRLDAGESIAGRVLDRLELERRGPGLALLFRSARRERPFLGPSVLGAAAAVFLALGGALLLQNALDEPLPRPVHRGFARAMAGTEANPMPLLSAVTLPMVTQPFPEPVLASLGEGSLFVETVVARDGHVAEVTLLDGDVEAAQPVLSALREERFQPGSLHGRPVAVSVYRLFSRMDVMPIG